MNKPELPDDLARLGHYLEAATGATVRRRQRRQAALNFIGAVVLSVPFALAVAAADLSSNDSLLPPPATITLEAEPPTNGFMVRHIPDEPLPPPSKERCLDAHDCRAPVSPSLQPAPAGKH